MPAEMDIRLLRHFLVLAEELQFSRAARRLYIAQQALSRDIQRLELRTGTPLFDRSTRRVTLTPAGRKLLTRTRQLLALHDVALRELHEEASSLAVDVVGPDLTPALVLGAARRKAPHIEFFAHFHSGTEAALPQLLTGQLDVTFGRDPDPPQGLRQRTVRYEPVAVLLPHRHHLAGLDPVPLASLQDTIPCLRAGNHATPGWEHAMHQLLAPLGIDPAGTHPRIQGTHELAEHIRNRNTPILTTITQPAVPGAVLRPVVNPVPLFPWTMTWRAHADHPGIRALHDAIDELTISENWLATPPDAWFPHPEEATVAPRDRR